MSIQHMRRRFAIHLRYMLYVLIAVFVITLPLVFAPGGLGGRDENEQIDEYLQDTVAEVNGNPVTREQVELQFERSTQSMLAASMMMGQTVGVERLWRYRLDALEQAIEQNLVLAEAQKQRVSASGREVTKRAEEIAKQQLDQFKLQLKGAELEQTLARVASSADGRKRSRMSERDFGRWLTKRLVEEDGEALKTAIITEKLQQKTVAGVSTTEKELLKSYDRVTVRQLVVSLRPRGKPERTKKEARERAEGLLARAKKGEDFAELVRAESDDEDVRYDEGVQPAVAPSRMSPEWQKGIAGVKVGGFSRPIETGQGYAIVKVESRDREVPDDFSKNKQKLLKDFVESKRNEAWSAHVTELREKAKVEVVDDEMLAYQALTEGDFDKALPLLEKAVPAANQIGGTASAAVHYQLATILASRNEWKKAAEAYAGANDALSGEGTLSAARAQALLGMGRSYENLKKPDEAVIWYQAAGDATDVVSIHEQLLQIYQRIGNEELQEREGEWMADYREAEEERNKAFDAQQRMMEEEAAKRKPKPKAAPVAPTTAPKGD